MKRVTEYEVLAPFKRGRLLKFCLFSCRRWEEVLIMLLFSFPMWAGQREQPALVAGGVSEACAHSCPAPGHTNYVTYIQ